MRDNLPVRRTNQNITRFYDEPGEVVPADQKPSEIAPTQAQRPTGIARIWASLPKRRNLDDIELDSTSIGQITATNVTIHVHGTTIQQHQEVVYGNRYAAVAQPPPSPPAPPSVRTSRDPLGALALVGVIALALVGAAFLAGWAWHAITSRTPSILIEERKPRSFVDYMREQDLD